MVRDPLCLKLRRCFDNHCSRPASGPVANSLWVAPVQLPMATQRPPFPMDPNPNSTTQASQRSPALGEASAAALLAESGSPASKPGQALIERLEGSRAPLPSLVGAKLVGLDLSGIDLSGVDLSGADLSRCQLEGAVFLGASLRAASLHEAQCERAEFGGAQLQGAHLVRANLRGASLGHANLDGAHFEGADLTGATLVDARAHKANFQIACLAKARLHDADLGGSSFSRADLRGVQLTGARVAHCNFVETDLRAATMSNMREYQSALWIGSDTREVEFQGAYLFRRHVRDQNYLHEFRNQSQWHRVLYWFWWLTSDCGRSLGRWSSFTAILVLAFAGAFRLVDIDYGHHPTPISPIYFSVVTMTTLGFGDVIPASTAAQVVTMLEVSTGYLMLGGLVSILSSKLARRAD